MGQWLVVCSRAMAFKLLISVEPLWLNLNFCGTHEYEKVYVSSAGETWNKTFWGISMFIYIYEKQDFIVCDFSLNKKLQ